MELINIKSTSLTLLKEKIMSLQQLVDHFNDTFAQEHQCNFHPFVLNNNKVTGVFGIAHINSKFTPIHTAYDFHLIEGYAAQAIASTEEKSQIKTAKVNRLLEKTLNKPGHVRSIISFDRLCRTVNLLNYLPLANNNNFLITEVDPYHILSIPYNHGAYFEEIIVYSGLKTQNVVISMTITGVHELHYPQLLKGLNNYRECGYKIALNIGRLISADKTILFINQLSPDYVIVTAPNESYSCLSLNSSLMAALQHLKELTASLGGQIMLQDVNKPEQGLCAAQIGFDLVEGAYYKKIAGNKLDLMAPKSDAKNYSYI